MKEINVGVEVKVKSVDNGFLLKVYEPNTDNRSPVATYAATTMQELNGLLEKIFCGDEQ